MYNKFYELRALSLWIVEQEKKHYIVEAGLMSVKSVTLTGLTNGGHGIFKHNASYCLGIH